jgi:two-component system, NarL family, invasion response regulator UvrY
VAPDRPAPPASPVDPSAPRAEPSIARAAPPLDGTPRATDARVDGRPSPDGRDPGRTDRVAVLVVDDQPPFRRAAAAVLRRAHGFVLVGEAGSGEEAVDAADQLRPDLVLMDIHLPGMSGIEATRRLVERAPSTVVLLCSTHDRADLPGDAATSGARAYVHKEELTPALLRALWDGDAGARGFDGASGPGRAAGPGRGPSG